MKTGKTSYYFCKKLYDLKSSSWNKIISEPMYTVLFYLATKRYEYFQKSVRIFDCRKKIFLKSYRLAQCYPRCLYLPWLLLFSLPQQART